MFKEYYPYLLALGLKKDSNTPNYIGILFAYIALYKV